MSSSLSNIVLAAVPAASENEGKLIAALKSNAELKERVDACRMLARVGTKEAVAPLAALLDDPKLAHMARYALEPIPSLSVDKALRDALGKLDGKLRIGVIGSLGVRRDAKAIKPLAGLLTNADPVTARAAARALGSIGTTAAAKAIDDALDRTPKANQLEFCEGLFRCAEALADDGKRKAAIGLYDRLRAIKAAPHQVRTGALRGAVLCRRKEGMPLLLEALRDKDFGTVEAAAHTALEMPGSDVTAALAAELSQLPADSQILLTQTLGKRADAKALPALFAAAKSGGKAVRVAAILAMPEIGDAKAAPVLRELSQDSDAEVAQAAKQSLAALPG